MNCICASADMTNRILFELVKLTGEVRQLRRVVEKQSVNRRAPTSSQHFIPELVDGAVTTIKGSRALLKSCAEKPQQDYLVSNIQFVMCIEVGVNNCIDDSEDRCYFFQNSQFYKQRKANIATM